MQNFWQVITGAPWWVYVLFIYLMINAIKSTKPRTISIKRIVLMPLFFVAWSFYSLYQKLSIEFHSSMLICWIVFLALGACLGVLEVRSWHFHSDRQKEEITIPGNYSTMVLILLIFGLNFVWGYIYATQAPVSYWVYLTDTITSSFVTGFFVGRAGFFFKSYHDSTTHPKVK